MSDFSRSVTPYWRHTPSFPPLRFNRERRRLGPWGTCVLVLLAGGSVIAYPAVKEAARPKVGECLAVVGLLRYPGSEIVDCGDRDAGFTVAVTRDLVGPWRPSSICSEHPDGEVVIIGFGKDDSVWEVCATPVR